MWSIHPKIFAFLFFPALFFSFPVLGQRADKGGAVQKNSPYTQLNSIASQYEASRYTQALMATKLLKNDCEGNKDCSDTVQFRIFSMAAFSCIRLGLTDSAEKYIQTAIEYSKRIEATPGIAYAVCLQQLGEVYYMQQLYDSSLYLLHKAKAILLQVNGTKTITYPLVLNTIANVLNSRGMFDEALEYLQQTLATYKYSGITNPEPIATLYGNIAQLYASIFSFHKANIYFKKALSLLQPLTTADPVNYAALKLNYATFLFQADPAFWPDAITHLQDAQKKLKAAGADTTITYVSILNTLGIMAISLNDTVNAKKYLLAADNLREKLKISAENTMPLHNNNLALLSLSLHKPDSALSFLQKSQESARQVYDSADYRNILFLLNSGAFYQLSKNYAKAAALYLKAVLGFRQSFNQNTMGLSVRDKYNLFYYYDALFNGIFEILHKEPARRKSQLAAEAFNILLEKNSSMYRQELRMLQLARGQNDSMARQLYNQWQHLEDSLHWLYGKLPKTAAYILDSLELEVDEKNRQLNYYSKSKPDTAYSTPLNTSYAARNLKKGEAVIIFFKYMLVMRNFNTSYINSPETKKSYYAAFVCRQGDSTPVFVPLAESDVFKDLIWKDQPYAADGYDARLYKNPVKNDTLYSVLWKPLTPYLHGISSIYTIQGGQTNNIVLGALQNSKKQYLADQYHFHRLFSIADLENRSSAPLISAGVEIWGNPDYNHTPDHTEWIYKIPVKNAETSGKPSIRNFRDLYDIPHYWDSLGNVKQELSVIQSLFPKGKTALFTGEKAGKRAFMLKEKPRGRVIHIATHGFSIADTAISITTLLKKDDFEQYEIGHTVKHNPLYNAGLIFAGGNYTWLRNPVPFGSDDGILTAGDVRHLDLSGTELAVLSSCLTARGDVIAGESSYSVLRGFKLAGVKAILSALWKVDDAATAFFMEAFYKRIKAGSSAYNAFEATQKEMRSSSYNAPYFWAGFILTE
jgi:CHAT domain-containing protein